ncbi:hypothetical protein C8R46DRAFT_1345792 [Mycena filopes]|nr:hypothetical protein C8R46DRAFT_1345792 [Mycena filopes]
MLPLLKSRRMTAVDDQSVFRWALSSIQRASLVIHHCNPDGPNPTTFLPFQAAQSSRAKNPGLGDDTFNVEKASTSSGESLPGLPRSRPRPGGHAPSPVDFQLPDAVPVRASTPRHFMRRKFEYPAGKSWRKLPLAVIHPKVIKYGQVLIAGRGEAPFYDDAFDDLDLAALFEPELLIQQGFDRVALRRDLLRVLGNTQSHLQGWMAYQALRSVPFAIPHRHLKRLVPGHTLADDEYNVDPEPTENPLPDIITYTTLINHAANERNGTSLGHSTSLLSGSHLDGVRASLLKMRQLGIDLGLDWAQCMHMGLLSPWPPGCRDVPEIYVGPDDVRSVKRALLGEGIEINVMAYHGHLKAALSAFQDMLTSENIEIGASMYRDEHGKLKPSPYSPTLPIFRALFLGFHRHGVMSAPDRPNTQPWVLDTLTALFEVFLALPEHIQPSTSTIYWALVAFDKTSDRDHDLLRTVWTRIENRFVDANWGSEGHRLERIRQTLFDSSPPEFNSRRRRE